jgi:uncharacterized protein YraI
MKRQSLFVWGISILSILILAALILVNQQQTFRFFESKDAHKKEMIAQIQPTKSLKLEQSEANSEPLTFPLDDAAAAPLFTTTKEMYINATSLNLRTGPSTDFDIVKTLFMGDNVLVGATITFDQFDYGEDDVEWVSIQSDDVFGFVNPNYLSEDTGELSDEQEDEATSLDESSQTNDSSSSDNNTTNKPTSSTNKPSSSDKETSNKDDSTADTDKTENEKPSTDKNETSDKNEKPQTTTKSRTETEIIYHKLIEINNPDLNEGVIKLVTEGENGILTITYKETYEGTTLIKTEEIKREITTKPKDEVVHIGTKPVTSEE